MAPASLGTLKFNEISLSLISFLESKACIDDVQLTQTEGVSPVQVTQWESRHRPCKLPEDLKSLLCVTNGLSLDWSVKFRQQGTPLGSLHLNSLANIVRVPVDTWPQDDDGCASRTTSHVLCCITLPVEDN